MKQTSVSVIIHFSKEAPYGIDGFYRVLDSIFHQSGKFQEIILISDSDISAEVGMKYGTTHRFISIPKVETHGASLNRAINSVSGSHILYVDNRQNEVILKNAAIELFLLAAHQENNWGMIYADYEILEEGKTREIHLLKHHIGRVRDNQDYGKVLFLNKMALHAIGNFNEHLQFNSLYDLRLKLSENHNLLHIANRYAGSLYCVKSSGGSHNVFDYLMASKESQVEAEEVLEGHLKRIGSNLEAGMYYQARPEAPAEATLKASIIIPVNNRPKFTGMAIESVQAQTVGDIEIIIVVNGGESDPTVESVKRYMQGGDLYDPAKPEVRLLIYDINNLGLCLNMGAWNARGVYYVQLDSDDRLKPDAVEKILKVFDEDPKIGMVIGSYEVWEQKENGQLSRMEDLPVVTHDEWTEENGRNNLLRINGAGAPRSIPIQLIREIGFSVNQEPYSRNYGEDYGMVLKISERHRIGRVWDAIYEVIRHDGGTDHSIDQATIDRNDEAKDFMRMEAINRRILLNKNKKAIEK